MHRVATKEREEIEKTSRGRPGRRWQDDRARKEGTTWNRKATNRIMEGIGGGLHPAVNGQSLGEG